MKRDFRKKRKTEQKRHEMSRIKNNYYATVFMCFRCDANSEGWFIKGLSISALFLLKKELKAETRLISVHLSAFLISIYSWAVKKYFYVFFRLIGNLRDYT